MKLNKPLFGFGVSKTKTNVAQHKWNYKIHRKKWFSVFIWVVVSVPIAFVLSLALYLFLSDSKLTTIFSVNRHLNSTNPQNVETSNSSLFNMTTDDKSDKTENPAGNQKDAWDDSKLEGERNKSDVVTVINRDENLVVNKDNTSSHVRFVQTEKPTKEVLNLSSVEEQVTTPRAFVYSPTVPQVTSRRTRADVTTASYNSSQDSKCFSTKLKFCEGILPYDMVQLPNVPTVQIYDDLTSMLPYIQLIVDSECSQRAKEFICSVLEPECQPSGYKEAFPCKLNCKVVAEACQDVIKLQALPVSRIFDCRRYPDWDENQDCVNLSKGTCQKQEFRCPDGSCVPLTWVCNGVHDCPGSRPAFDEQNCSGCSANEFRCISEGKCIPLRQKCNGELNCLDESDEIFC